MRQREADLGVLNKGVSEVAQMEWQHGTNEELLHVRTTGLGGGDGVDTDDLNGVGAGLMTGSHLAVCRTRSGNNRRWSSR